MFLDTFTPSDGCYVFSQDDNPTDLTGQTPPAGFVYVSGPEDWQSDPHRLVGLSMSTPSYNYMDGDLRTAANFYWSIGLWEAVVGGIPGPPRISMVQTVELYVIKWA